MAQEPKTETYSPESIQTIVDMSLGPLRTAVSVLAPLAEWAGSVSVGDVATHWEEQERNAGTVEGAEKWLSGIAAVYAELKDSLAEVESYNAIPVADEPPAEESLVEE